ncbi:hypothetical protein BOX15_Mlig019940g1 [Macrostomum lignano]|uniref:Uncharacterized protein n=1 Tax=Macrostomum lignano TaxID=282301 RepID=A0A267F9K0_9PLAT|nr:hypothetical protein BOX15_Mlig019940g1 [Macrostomum lignano]
MEMCSGPIGTSASSGGQIQFVLQSGPAFLPAGFTIAQPAQQQQHIIAVSSTIGTNTVSSTTSAGSVPATLANGSQQQQSGRRLPPRSIMPRPLVPKVSANAPLQPKPLPAAAVLPTTTTAALSVPAAHHTLTRPASCTFQAFQLPPHLMTAGAALFAPAAAGAGGLFFSPAGAVFVDDCSTAPVAAATATVAATVAAPTSKSKKSKKKAPAAKPSVPIPVSKPHPLCHSLSDSNLLRRTDSQSPGGQDLLLMACQEAGLHLGDVTEALAPQPSPALPQPAVQQQQQQQQPEQVPNVDSSVEAAECNDNSLLTELGLLAEQQVVPAQPNCCKLEDEVATPASLATNDRPQTPVLAADDSFLKLFDQSLNSGAAAAADDASTAAPVKPDSSSAGAPSQPPATPAESVEEAAAPSNQAAIEDKVIVVDDSIVEAVDPVESAEKLLFSDSFVESWNDCLQFATLEAPPPPPSQPPPPILEQQLPPDAPVAAQLSAAPTCNRVLSETLRDRPTSPLPCVLHPESEQSASAASTAQVASTECATAFLDCWTSDLPAMPIDLVDSANDEADEIAADDRAANNEHNGGGGGVVSSCQSLVLDDFFSVLHPGPETEADTAASSAATPPPPRLTSQPNLATGVVEQQQSEQQHVTPPTESQQQQQQPPRPPQDDTLNTPTAGSVLTAAMALSYALRDPPDLLRCCPPLQFPASPPPRLAATPNSLASTASTVPATAASDCDCADDGDAGGNQTLTTEDAVCCDSADDLPPPVLSPAPSPSPSLEAPPPASVDRCCPSPAAAAYSPISEPEPQPSPAPCCTLSSMVAAPAVVSMASVSTGSSAPPSASSDQCPPSTGPSSTFVDDYDDYENEKDGANSSDSDCEVASPLIDTLVKAMLSATESLETSGTAGVSSVQDEAPPPPVLHMEPGARSLSTSSSSSGSGGDLSAPSLACLARQIVQSATEAVETFNCERDGDDNFANEEVDAAPPTLDRIVAESPLPLPPVEEFRPPPRLSKAALKCNYEKPRQFDLVPQCQASQSSPSKRFVSPASTVAAKYSPKKPLKLLLKEKRRAMAAAATSAATLTPSQLEEQPSPAAVSTPARRLKIKIRPIRSPQKPQVVTAAVPAASTPPEPTCAGPSASSAVSGGGGLKIRLNLRSLGLAPAAGSATPPSTGEASQKSESSGGKSKRQKKTAEASANDEAVGKQSRRQSKKRKSKSSSRRKSAASAAAQAGSSELNSGASCNADSQNRHKRSRLSIEGGGGGGGNSDAAGCVRERLTLRLPLRHSWAPSATN